MYVFWIDVPATLVFLVILALQLVIMYKIHGLKKKGSKKVKK